MITLKTNESKRYLKLGVVRTNTDEKFTFSYKAESMNSKQNYYNQYGYTSFAVSDLTFYTVSEIQFTFRKVSVILTFVLDLTPLLKKNQELNLKSSYWMARMKIVDVLLEAITRSSLLLSMI